MFTILQELKLLNVSIKNEISISKEDPTGSDNASFYVALLEGISLLVEGVIADYNPALYCDTGGLFAALSMIDVDDISRRGCEKIKIIYQEINKIHQELKEFKKFSEKIAWEYSYPLGENEEITNNAINEWHCGDSPSGQVDSSTSSCLQDFIRSVVINGVPVSEEDTDETIRPKLQKLLEPIFHDTDKVRLAVDWMMINGGQKVQRIVDMLLKYEIKQKSIPNENLSLLSATNNRQLWYVDNGKMFCQHKTFIDGLLVLDEDFQNIPKVLFISCDSDKNPDEMSYLKKDSDLVFFNEKTDKKAGKNILPPIMMVETLIELRFKEEKSGMVVVFPAVIGIKITSCTHSLTIPFILYLDLNEKKVDLKVDLNNEIDNNNKNPFSACITFFKSFNECNKKNKIRAIEILQKELYKIENKKDDLTTEKNLKPVVNILLDGKTGIIIKEQKDKAVYDYLKKLSHKKREDFHMANVAKIYHRF